MEPKILTITIASTANVTSISGGSTVYRDDEAYEVINIEHAELIHDGAEAYMNLTLKTFKKSDLEALTRDEE